MNKMKIKKWVSYISGWKDRNIYLDGALLSYSKENKDGKEEIRRCAFLGICLLEQEDDYLKIYTGSRLLYFKGDNEEKTIELKNLIENGISKGKEILQNNKQNFNLIPQNFDKKDNIQNNFNLFPQKFEDEVELINADNTNKSTELEKMIDEKSECSLSSSDINNNTYKKILKNLESKIKIRNMGFNGYIEGEDFEKDELKEIYKDYENIQKKLKKINNFLNNSQ